MHASRLQHDTTGMKVQRQRKSTTPAPMSYDAYLKLRESLEIPPPPRRSPYIAPPWESQQWVPVFRESYLLKLDEELSQPTTKWETNQLYFSRESGRFHPYNRWEFGTEEEDDTDRILEKIGAALSASASASRASGSTQRNSRGRGPRSGMALPPSLLQKQSTGAVASGRPSTSRNPSSSASRKGKGREAHPPEASSASRVGVRPSVSTHLSSSSSASMQPPISDRKGKRPEVIPLAPSTAPNGGLERRPYYRPELTATPSQPFVVYQQLPDARRPPIPQNDLQRHQSFGPGPSSYYRPTASVAGPTRAPFSQTNVNSQPTTITTSPANFSQDPHFSGVNIIDGQLASTRMQFSQEAYDLAKLEIMSRLMNGE